MNLQDELLWGIKRLRTSKFEGRLVEAQEQVVEAQAMQLVEFLSELKRWNRAYNLTAIEDPAQMVIRHILDSLSVAPWVQGRVLDVGTGAGLPGIPLAIMDSELDMTLLDSTNKKIRFLNHVTRKLKLQNIQTEHARVEEFSALAPFDVVVSRAFSSLADYAESTRHLLGPRSRLLAMKGRHPNEEISALPGWISVEATEKLAVPGLHEDRHLVIMSLT
ncbi:MAG TPA: 16S rRNA (guanine(527)-N(7))-methyltransferase RsmG [Xanthomonadales bacterium]|nr:16S rRNA (guanine(527)-N(7))-methyltransferase RsmG [Xanthomonadales bacterium]